MKGDSDLKPYASCIINTEDQEKFRRIKNIFDAIPEIDLGIDTEGNKILVSCHMLTRVFSDIFHIDYYDGYFGKIGFCHSWLETENSIIDVYPIAVLGGPIMVDKKYPWISFYIKSELRPTAFGNNYDLFLENVAKVKEIILKTAKSLSISVIE